MRKQSLWAAAAVAAAVAGLAWALHKPTAADIHSKCVVRVSMAGENADFYEPWKPGPTFQLEGAGCIVPGYRILTTARMANRSTYIEVKKYDETRRFVAKVEEVDQDLDLALLSVDDQSFFIGTVPVEFGGLPSRGDKLLIQGGDKLAIKEDSVAAISLVRSEESMGNVPAVLTSQEIEASNNGCGVFCKGKLVGIPFDSQEKPDKTGSLIPAPVIQRFLRGAQAGRGHGEVPSLGIYTQELESLALKAYHKVPAKGSGVLVSRVLSGGSAEGLLKEGDVLTAVDGHAVDGEGSVNLERVGRISASYLMVYRLPGEELSLDILRDGRPLKLSVPLKAAKGLVPYDEGERHPPYLMKAGFVFVQLTANYFANANWEFLKPMVLDLYYHGLVSKDRKQVVLISHVLPHPINIGYGKLNDLIVSKVNGQPITEMADLAPAFAKPMDGFHVIEVEDHPWYGTKVVIDAAEAETATAQVMQMFGIAKDRSEGL